MPIVDKVKSSIALLKEDDKKTIRDFGIEYAVKQCRELIEYGVPGIHIYTMDRSKSALAIINALKNTVHM